MDGLPRPRCVVTRGPIAGGRVVHDTTVSKYREDWPGSWPQLSHTSRRGIKQLHHERPTTSFATSSRPSRMPRDCHAVRWVESSRPNKQAGGPVRLDPPYWRIAYHRKTTARSIG